MPASTGDDRVTLVQANPHRAVLTDSAPDRAAPVGEEQRRWRRPGLLIAGGWLLLCVLVVLALASVGDSPVTVVTYLLVWLVSTTVPGVLVWRALSRPNSLVQDLGFGSVLGTGLLLLAWVPATLAGHPALIWLWPVTAAALFGLVPGLRRHWIPRRLPQHRTSWRWHVAMMTVALLAFLRLWAGTLTHATLPAHRSRIFQDVWYELALTQRLRYSVVIDDPAIAGVRLQYHWFSNAFASATQSLSGAPTFEVIMHLWLVGMLFTFVFAVAAASEKLLEGTPAGSHDEVPARWWPGPLAVLLAAVFPVTLNLATPRLKIDNGFVISSTSGILALCIILALVGPVCDLVRGQSVRGTWAALGLLLLLSTGSKPSILPVVACGSALTVVVQWVQTRRFPRVAAIVTLASVVLIPLAALTLFGSTGGSRPQLFSTLGLDSAMQKAAGTAMELPGHGGWLAPDLVNASARVWGVAAGVLLLYTLTELPRLLGVLAVGHRRVRTDPGVWWCAGVVAAGYAGLWTLAHPAYSQHYFWRIVIGLGVVLSVTSVVRLLPEGSERRGVRTELVVYGVVAVITGIVLALVDPHQPRSVPGRLVPYGIVLAVMLLAWGALTLIWHLARRRDSAGGTRTRLPFWVVVSTFCAGTGLAAAAGAFGGPVGATLIGQNTNDAPHQRDVTRAEQSAALWLEEHSAPDDVVATNVFCAVPRYRDQCPHVAFWVPALTGRQQYVGAWAYTDNNLREYALGHLDYQRMPPPWPDRVALSLEAVRSPSAEVVAKLRRDGVRWIYADRRATRVSPELGRFARLRYANSDVRIYEIPR